MQSCQVMFGNNSIINGVSSRVQFHGCKTVYPLGERIQCFFTVPELCQPESGDWIGIFPVGWNSIVRDCIVKQIVRPEECCTGQFGKVEFDFYPHFQAYAPLLDQHQFQFVYVSGQEPVVIGTPFRFVRNINGNVVIPTTPRFSTLGSEWQNVVIPRPFETESIESQLCQLEQQWSPITTGVSGGVWPTNTTVTTTGVWPSRLGKIEQILREKVRLEQAQRRLDQLSMFAQVKSCERHIVNVMKREPEIRDFLLRVRVAQKLAEFEQKVVRIQQQQQQQGSIVLSTPVEQYVRKYEQLLREKIVLDMERRRVSLHKMRQTLRECERKLRDLQLVDQEHFGNFYSVLRQRIQQISTPVMQLECEVFPSQQFESVMGPFLGEQDRLSMNLWQAQRELFQLVAECCTRLQSLEYADCYSQLRIPRICTGLMSWSPVCEQFQPRLGQIMQLERKIAEQKLKLRLRMLAMQQPRFVEQLQRGVWFTPVVEKLRVLQQYLRQVMLGQQVSVVSQQPIQSRYWFEKKAEIVGQMLQTLCQYQTEVRSCFVEQPKLRSVLSQLRELRERHICDIPRFIQQEYSFAGIPVASNIVECCQQIGEILSEKIGQLSQFVQIMPVSAEWSTINNNWQIPYYYNCQIPFESILAAGLTTGTGAQFQVIQHMIELCEIERKLVEMKAVQLQQVQFGHIEERCGELEQLVRVCSPSQLAVVKRERCLEKIRVLRQLLAEQTELVLPTTTPLGFLTVPEQYTQHFARYERLCQLAHELECHFIENVCFSGIFNYLPTTTTTVLPTTSTVLPTTTGLFNVHQRFVRLVQEFQLQFPECFAPKVDEICQYLRSVQLYVRQPVVSQRVGLICQQLKEKLVEFETILCQPECEIACLTTSIFPQSSNTTTRVQRECLRQLIRQVREIKQYVQMMLVNNTFVIPSEIVEQQQQILQQQQISVDVLPQQQQLSDMLNRKLWIGRQQQQQQQQVVEQTTTSTSTSTLSSSTVVPSVVVPTTTQTTTTVIESQQQPARRMIVKSVSVPSQQGLIKPIGEYLVNECCTVVGEENNNNVVRVIPQQRSSVRYELVNEDSEDNEEFYCDEDSEEFDGVTISAVLPNVVRIESGLDSESCLCQIEKHIKRCMGQQWEQTAAELCCPLCPTTSVLSSSLTKF